MTPLSVIAPAFDRMFTTPLAPAVSGAVTVPLRSMSLCAVNETWPARPLTLIVPLASWLIAPLLASTVTEIGAVMVPPV